MPLVLPVLGAGLLDHKGRIAPIDIRRQQWNADLHDLLAKQIELVLIAAVHGHGRGVELDRVVGLQIGGLIGEQRIGGGVGLVEAVGCELGDLLENRRGQLSCRCRV